MYCVSFLSSAGSPVFSPVPLFANYPWSHWHWVPLVLWDRTAFGYLTVTIVHPPQRTLLVYVFTATFVQVLSNLTLLGKMMGIGKVTVPQRMIRTCKFHEFETGIHTSLNRSQWYAHLWRIRNQNNCTSLVVGSREYMVKKGWTPGALET